MERKITLTVSGQQEIQELLAGLKNRQQQTQTDMRENAGRIWILKGLNRQRTVQRKMICAIKKQLNSTE